MNGLTIAGLALEALGFAVISLDLFKMRNLENLYGKYLSIVDEINLNSAQILFGSAVSVNTLHGQLAVVLPVEDKIRANLASTAEVEGRKKALNQIASYAANMVDPNELLDLQKEAVRLAKELKQMNSDTSAKRAKIHRLAIFGTLLVLTGGVIQLTAASTQ